MVEAKVAAVEVVTAVGARLRPHFRREAAYGHACAYLRGLLGGAERTNGRQLAEEAGYRNGGRSSACWTVRCGMPRRCAMQCAGMSRPNRVRRTACWSSTRPAS
jgi:hypothetical protein